MPSTVVNCISASVFRSRWILEPVMRPVSGTFLLSLPVKCSRSNPAPPFTVVLIPKWLAKPEVVSTVITSSPAPPVSVFAPMKAAAAVTFSFTKSAMAFTSMRPTAMLIPPDTWISSFPSPPSTFSSVRPISIAIRAPVTPVASSLVISTSVLLTWVTAISSFPLPPLTFTLTVLGVDTLPEMAPLIVSPSCLT